MIWYIVSDKIINPIIYALSVIIIVIITVTIAIITVPAHATQVPLPTRTWVKPTFPRQTPSVNGAKSENHA